MKYLLILFLFCSCSERNVFINRIIDSDTYVTSTGEHIRLSQADGIEHNQFYGDRAAAFASYYLLGRTVKIHPVGRSYGRTVAEVYVGNIWFNKEIIDSGYAWAYKKYASSEIYNSYLTARQNKRGMWQYEYNIAPYIFRNLNHKNER